MYFSLRRSQRFFLTIFLITLYNLHLISQSYNSFKMRYSDFFVLLVHVLFIQCKDFDTFSSNQELSMRTIQPKIRILIYSSTKTSQSNLFAPSKSLSENVYIDPVKKYKLKPVNIDWSWHVFCGSHGNVSYIDSITIQPLLKQLGLYKILVQMTREMFYNED